MTDIYKKIRDAMAMGPTRGPLGKTEADAIELWNRRDGIV